MEVIEPKKSNEKISPESWVNEYGDILFRFAMRRLNSMTVAEDLVQETFLSALKSYAKFNAQSSINTWLISILKNKIIDHYRKAGRDNESADVDMGQDPSDSFDEKGHWITEKAPADWGTNPEKSFEQSEFMEIFKSCLSRLPAKIASIFSLREVEKVESKKICKDFNITSSNLWVMLHRARTQLRRCLELNWFGQNA